MNKVNIWLRNLGLKTNICPFLIHFMQSNASLTKKSIMHNDFIGKNLYSVGGAKLRSTSVVMLNGMEHSNGSYFILLHQLCLGNAKSSFPATIIGNRELYTYTKQEKGAFIMFLTVFMHCKYIAAAFSFFIIVHPLNTVWAKFTVHTVFMGGVFICVQFQNTH